MTFDPQNAVDLIRERDKRLVKSRNRDLTDEEKLHNATAEKETAKDIADLCSVLGDPWRAAILEHLAGFNHTPHSGEELMARGYQGRAIGEQQRFEIQSAYMSSLKWWMQTRNLPLEAVK